MRDYTWIDMMKIMQEIRLFSTLHVRRAKKEGITSAQEMDLLSRIVLSDHALTPQDLTVHMGLCKSAVSRLIDHLEKKGFLKKHYCETDKRSYVLLHDLGASLQRQEIWNWIAPIVIIWSQSTN